MTNAGNSNGRLLGSGNLSWPGSPGIPIRIGRLTNRLNPLPNGMGTNNANDSQPYKSAIKESVPASLYDAP